MLDLKQHRVPAAAVAIGYMAIQSFQEFAFSQMTQTSDPVQELLQGADPINIVRAVLLLLSFFGLIYLYLICCARTFHRRPITSILAMLGCFTFCVLEIQLRSVELFYVFLRLPAEYQATTDPASRAELLRLSAIFAGVQRALYFPLGLSWLGGSALLCFAVGRGRYDWLARFAFGLNAIRLGLRTLDSYVLGLRFDDLYSQLYLPLVFATYAPIAVWMLGRESADAGQERR